MKNWSDLDKRYLWHPFTQMLEWTDTDPLVIQRGEGNYLIDTDGRRYLDGISSLWVNVHGHCRDALDKAIIEQLGIVAHSTLLGLSSIPSIALAEKLVKIVPEGLTRVFYSDSGSTAVEVALKMAFQYWRNLGRHTKRKFVTLAEAYHGDTIGSVSLGQIDLFHSIFQPLLFHTFSLPTPFPYRHPDLSLEECRDRSLDHLRALAEDHAEEIAAVVVEPLVQGAAGMIVHPPGFLRGVESLCREFDILLVCDEVATGFGRTGKMFACEHEGVRPDLMSVAKGLSGGYLPLAATLATEKIYEAFLGEYAEYKTFFHGHSYTGNALACAVACANLDIFESERILEQLQPKIALLQELLSTEIAPLPHVGEVRQCGFMVGIEIVEDSAKRQSYAPELRTGARITQDVRSRGVILRPLGDVVVMMPPLSVTQDEIRTLVASTAQSIAKVCGA
ncbi:adenosylmethionine--8-amino-7-oxononanoate transaminase [Desulfomonile tiedjei]|uniref:Adenosylmethionine-8-amino-7-oxononanoate aminotransferase n=1 Tax=Desulfomonile tiedjei (strain ATCC 49306 / DSM 6799 / DCB-1) TaxID=706587 RepID=I4C9Q5_DESTA|nr:adenosylmethionine--8-amino-7-oxononanoate transaminase [Desulfomonile tiedjei]AFM26296.1 adenosylmethionine-8-amino-7-oxononanoate transaminase [Desulfomonile tiedjei DSM 6799]